MDAATRVSKLRLQRGQQADAARVLLECCGQEGHMAPYLHHTSPIPRPHLPYTSPTSPVYLPYISEQEGVFNRFYALLGALTLTLTLTLTLP